MWSFRGNQRTASRGDVSQQGDPATNRVSAGELKEMFRETYGKIQMLKQRLERIEEDTKKNCEEMARLVSLNASIYKVTPTVDIFRQANKEQTEQIKQMMGSTALDRCSGTIQEISSSFSEINRMQASTSQSLLTRSREDFDACGGPLRTIESTMSEVGGSNLSQLSQGLQELAQELDQSFSTVMRGTEALEEINREGTTSVDNQRELNQDTREELERIDGSIRECAGTYRTIFNEAKDNDRHSEELARRYSLYHSSGEQFFDGIAENNRNVSTSMASQSSNLGEVRNQLGEMKEKLRIIRERFGRFAEGQLQPLREGSDSSSEPSAAILSDSVVELDCFPNISRKRQKVDFNVNDCPRSTPVVESNSTSSPVVESNSSSTTVVESDSVSTSRPSTAYSNYEPADESVPSSSASSDSEEIFSSEPEVRRVTRSSQRIESQPIVNGGRANSKYDLRSFSEKVNYHEYF